MTRDGFQNFAGLFGRQPRVALEQAHGVSQRNVK
jgi:hypothetical protein